MVLHHAQQIKDIAKHLLELKQLVTPMMEFKRSGWVGLTNDEVNNLAAGCHLGNSVQGAIYKAEAKLKDKNT